MGKAKFCAVIAGLGLMALFTGSCSGKPEPPPVLESGDAVWAREQAIDYIRTNNGHAPPADTAWVEKDVAPEGIQGLGIIVFDSPDWSVTVSLPLEEPKEDAVYAVNIDDIILGWYWKGSVDSDGNVTETCVLSRG